MRTKKRQAPAKPPETTEQKAKRLAEIGAVWRLEVPFYKKDSKKDLKKDLKKKKPSVNHFPPEGVTPYSYIQVLSLLRIFCQKYTGNTQLPPAELDPVAVEVNSYPVDDRGCLRPLYRFTLKDVDAEVRALAKAPIASHEDEDEEDEAERWLRSQGH